MLFKAMIIAFSMYSKIPMPRVDWNEKNMRYALCFFPIVGLVIGVIMYFMGLLLFRLNIGSLLFGCIMTVTPVLITGGIHFDGFLDTIDGISSYADKDKRLEILKDSNSGAFAITGGLVYFTLSVGFWSEVKPEMLGIIAIGYTMSRTLSALSVVTFPKAKKSGLVAYFNNGADKKAVKITMVIFICMGVLAVTAVNPAAGIAVVAVSLVCFLYHYYNCIKNFGGITGDLAGYFLQLCELFILMTTVILLGRCLT